MRRVRYLIIRAVYVLFDVVLLTAAFYFACRMQADRLPFEPRWTALFFDPDDPFRFSFLLWIVVQVLCAYNSRLYETRREFSEGLELWQVTRCALIAASSVVLANFALKIEGFPRSILFLGLGLDILFLSLWRVLKRLLVQGLIVRGYNNFNVLIVGAGKVGSALAAEIRRRPTLGWRVVGFLDDYKTEHPTERILGTIEDFPEIAQREFVNLLFITIHNDHSVFLRLLEQAKKRNIAVRVVPHGFGLITGELGRFQIGIIPVLEYFDAGRPGRQTGKRLFDLGASLAALILLAPVFLLIALGIKRDDPGPVFYRSRRYGRRGRPFDMLKFRTMRVGADAMLPALKDRNEADGPIFKIRDDPRVTPFGRFLRRYSLDELPQLVNVLLGQMSLVGPRPLPVDQIERGDLRQFRRLEVRPGMTGLWQISGRSDVSFGRLLRWDLWYIDNWSFWLDLTVLLRTIPVVLKARGSY